MEIKYRWERNECYMLVDAGGISADHYQLRMLENNRIDGLLKVQLQQINQQSEFCYTISGKQSMVQRYENVCISVEDIKKLMAALNKTAGQLEEFLLNIDSLRLEPEWIYWKEDEDGQPEFCYYPEEVPEKSFRGHVRTLLQYLLNKISHKDPDAVNAAYGLYQIGIKETFRMQELMQFLFYGTEENEDSGKEASLPSELWENVERGTGDMYEAADYEIPDEGGRRKKQREKQQKQQKQQQKQNEKQNQDRWEGQRQKQRWEQQQKQRRAPGQRRFADYILSLLIAVLALAAVLRLAFLWYGRREAMSEKEAIIHIGLICAIVVVSGIAIYKLVAKSNVSTATAWESPEETVNWEHVREYGQKQETFADKCLTPESKNSRKDAECSKNLFQWETVSGIRNTPPYWENIPQQGNIPEWRSVPEQKSISEQRTMPEQGAISAQGDISDQRDFSEATCVLSGISGSTAGGWWFRYQGTEKIAEDFFLSDREGRIMVGKKLKAPDIALNRSTVSRHHAVFQIENGICTVRDNGSTNGTYLDGERLGREETRVLFPGCELKFADVVFRVEKTDRDENATTILTGL